MPENQHLRFLLRLLYAGLALAGVWAALRFLVPWFLPFLAALALAALLEGPVRFLEGRCHVPRRWGAGICTALLAGTALGLLALVLWRGWYELSLLLGRLPTLLAELPALGGRLESWAYRFLVALPVRLQAPAKEALDGLLSEGLALPSLLYDELADLTAAAVTALPAAGLFLFTTLLATYFTSAGRPELLSWARGVVPAAWRTQLDAGAAGMKKALGGWLRAQGILMLLTFGEVTVGLLILRVDLALLAAGLAALVDALPIFGAGTVLVPWALWSLLDGDWPLALGLLILYGVVTLVRTLLEPKLVGKRVGLHPLAALAAMYVGFQVFGVAGMILTPLGAVIGKQVWKSVRTK